MKKNAEKEAEKKIVEETCLAQESAVKPETETETKTETKNGLPGVATENTSESAKLIDLSARIVELEKLNAELNDQYLRKSADFDNYRKRMLKEKQDAIDYANTNLLVDLIQILDDFERAIASAGDQEPGSKAAAFTDGITIIRKQLGTMLENKYGLAHYPVKGELFDPHVHEAIGTIPSQEATEPTVMEEFVKGYKLKERVIRVAKVMVSTPVENEKQ